MEAFRSWLLAVIAAAMILSILRALLPPGSIRAIGGTTGALILLLVMLRPVLGRDWRNLGWHVESYQAQIDEQVAAYGEAREKELAEIIQEKTAAYIWDKAQELGLSCRAQVETELRDGVPVPSAVTMDIPRSGELSALIERELAIPPERQYWLGE